MHGVGRRALAVGALGAGIVAAIAAVVAALAAPTGTPTIAQADAADAPIVSRTVAFGHARVAVHVRPGGLTCFAVDLGSSTVGRSCAMNFGPDEIAYAASHWAVGGIAGNEVRAVIVRLTRKGTVWATLRNGAFYAAVPAGYEARAVVKVLAGGGRTAFTISVPR